VNITIIFKVTIKVADVILVLILTLVDGSLSQYIALLSDHFLALCCAINCSCSCPVANHTKCSSKHSNYLWQFDKR